MTTGPAAPRLAVDLADGTPAFEQIRRQVVAHVAAGRLAPGDRLPTIRALAADLGLAAGTVARAYRELEAAGVVETRRRSGTTVAPGAVRADAAVRSAAAALVRAGREARLSDDEVVAALRGALLATAPAESGATTTGGAPTGLPSTGEAPTSEAPTDRTTSAP